MAGKIFISYRRDDSAANALGIGQYLEREFGRRNVFIDIDMRAGAKFPVVLEERLAECKVLIALIGPAWLDARDKAGKRRLDDPDDWVRLEISHALKRGITVIPVCVGGAELPAKWDLPEDVRGLIDHQAASVTTTGFRNEMAGLTRDIRAIPRPWLVKRIAAAVAAVVSVLLVAWIVLYQIGVPVWLPWANPSAADADKANAEHEAKRKADEEAKRKSEEEAKRKADEEARRTAENDAKRKAEEETRHRAEEEARRKDEEARKRAEAEARRDPALAVKPGSGESFRDRLRDGQPCPTCPEMVVVPAGKFMMGSPEQEKGRSNDEGPHHNVNFVAPFAIGKFSVTRGEFAAFVSDTSHKIDARCFASTMSEWWKDQPDRTWRSPGFDQDDRHPVVCISWNDAKAFIDWLSAKTGKPYRFLTEAETEYAMRAGTTTRYSFGDDEVALPQYAWYNANSGSRTHPVGEKKPNGFGLFDVHGNAWTWCQDGWHPNYQGAPTDGSAWAGGDRFRHVQRGGAWNDIPGMLRSAFRVGAQPEARNYVGFRVVRTLAPPNP
jgi:formylglycine-generating enzyme required for sulfatase activity